MFLYIKQKILKLYIQIHAHKTITILLKIIPQIIKQQISDKKNELGFAERLANNKKLQKDLSKNIAHEEEMGASNIKDKLEFQLKGLKAEEINLK